MNFRNAQVALALAHQYDEEGSFEEADFLTRVLIRTAQADESLAAKVGNAISHGGYALQNWGANAFLGGGQNSERVVSQIDYFINQMQSNRFLRDPNQKAALLAALQEARQIAYTLTAGYWDQKQQTQQQNEAQLASQLLAPKADTPQQNVRTADDRSIPVIINDIQNLANFAHQAYAGRDQRQVALLISALNKARAIMMGHSGYYTPAPSSYPQMGAAKNGTVPAALDPTHLNAQQKEFFDKYMRIGIAQGRDAMMQKMNSNPYHTAPFKQMVMRFWDEQLSPKLAMRKQMMQSPNNAA